MHNDRENFLLSKDINSYIDDLIADLKEDFDYYEVQRFVQLDPKNFPENEEDQETYGLNENLSLMSVLEITNHDFVYFFNQMIKQILSLHDYSQLKCLTTELFWAEILRRKEILWTTDLKRIVRFGLS